MWVVPEDLAKAIFEAAIDEGRCGELLVALLDGGSATIDRETKKLVIVSGDMLARLAEADDN